MEEPPLGFDMLTKGLELVMVVDLVVADPCSTGTDDEVVVVAEEAAVETPSVGPLCLPPALSRARARTAGRPELEEGIPVDEDCVGSCSAGTSAHREGAVEEEASPSPVPNVNGALLPATPTGSTNEEAPSPPVSRVGPSFSRDSLSSSSAAFLMSSASSSYRDKSVTGIEAPT